MSRLSAVNLGYLDDPFAQHFVQMHEAPRRLPIINRGKFTKVARIAVPLAEVDVCAAAVGTYTRTRALDRLIDSFLASDEPGEGSGGTTQATEKQIISLGAGTDTRIFRLLTGSGPSRRALIYHELDFPESVRKKRCVVQASAGLTGILGRPVIGQSESWSCGSPNGAEYYCHATDLRDFSSQSHDSSPLKGLRTDVPTLLISECCLCYLEPAAAGAVVDWFVARITSIAAMLYEPIQPNDSFGKMMVSNLAQRRIRLPTLATYPTTQHEKQRLLDAGFAEAGALTVREIWDRWFTPEEKERVDSIEGLDELEEWHMLADHYVVAWAWRSEAAKLEV